MAILIIVAMQSPTFTLEELAQSTGLEARTIRNYIERGLIPGSQSRGRAASYGEDHLILLRVIKLQRAANPNVTLAEIRTRLQKLTPEAMRRLSEGRLSAVGLIDANEGNAGDETLVEDDDDEIEEGHLDDRLLGPFTDPKRLLRALRQIAGGVARSTTSKAERWHRIAVTEDIEIVVRAGFTDLQVEAFCEVAHLLRELLTRPEVSSVQSQNDQVEEDDA